jgi:hypothetical protein
MSEHIVPRPELTAEKLRELLHYDPETGIFTWKVRAANLIKVGDITGCPGGDGYLRIGLHNRLFLAHRLVWLYVYGEWPSLDIDHINRNKADNRISNLRDVSHKQNHQNKSKPSNNTSGHPGVSWYKRISKWQARIMHNYKHIHLGLFENIEDAIAARKAAEKLYWSDTQVAEPAPV